MTESKACIDRKFFHTHTPAAAIFYRIVTFSKCPLGLYRSINVVTAAYLIPLGIIKNVNIFNGPTLSMINDGQSAPNNNGTISQFKHFSVAGASWLLPVPAFLSGDKKVALAKFGTMLDQLMQTKEMM